MILVGSLRRSITSAGGLSPALLDLTIGTARKVAGFCALLALGRLYLRELALGQSCLRSSSARPIAIFGRYCGRAAALILAQDWDIPTDHIAAHFEKVFRRLPYLHRLSEPDLWRP